LRPDIVLSIADKLTFILLILLEYTDPCLEAEFISSVTNTLASPHIVDFYRLKMAMKTNVEINGMYAFWYTFIALL
jgi:hypothetical protein